MELCLPRLRGVLFFPLAIVVGVVSARRWPLPWALAAGTALFGLAVVTAWQVQGFEPSTRDLAWLAVVAAATYLSWRRRPRGQEAGTVRSGPTGS